MLCIAFVGLGRMGTPMCAALAKAGYEVTATDNRAERKPAALACGAGWRVRRWRNWTWRWRDCPRRQPARG